MSTIKIISTSKDNSILMESIESVKQMNAVNTDFNINLKLYSFKNNRLGLSEHYNSLLAQERKLPIEERAEAFILIHGDVQFDSYSIIKRYLEIKDKYDLIGLAGAKKIKVSQSPLTWFTASKDYPDERYGIVKHDNFGESFFNGESHPDVKDTRVAAVDGLCMILGSNIINSDITFDEQFKYDFYDLDFCMNCNMNYKFKIGVMVEPVYHKSVGMSVLSIPFLEVEKVFKAKWKI